MFPKAQTRASLARPKMVIELITQALDFLVSSKPRPLPKTRIPILPSTHSRTKINRHTINLPLTKTLPRNQNQQDKT
ncbi:unnamed protein product [Prunus brigantina]